MQMNHKTAALIAGKVRNSADVLIFSPVFDCRNALLEAICDAVSGRILCILQNTPHEAYRKTFSGSNRFFLGRSLQHEQIASTYKFVQNSHSCVVFASLSMLQRDDFIAFVNETAFSAMLVLQAENISPILGRFDKRLRLIADLRAQLQYTLPVCAFCATDSSVILRDITAQFGLRTPTRVYPGTKAPDSQLLSFQTTPPFAAFENRARHEKIDRALVLCNSRQIAEDAYRYFRFFGYSCAVAHGGIALATRTRAVNRFANGETSFLFTTCYTQSAFTLLPYTTACLGIPSDVYALFTDACPQRDILVYYTEDDKKDYIYKIEADNEILSAYTNLPPYRLRQERLFLHAQMLNAITENKSPYEVLKTNYTHIYDDNTDSEKQK